MVRNTHLALKGKRLGIDELAAERVDASSALCGANRLIAMQHLDGAGGMEWCLAAGWELGVSWWLTD